MIKIHTFESGDSYRIAINGHAMYSEKEDIVCAAASILYYSLLLSLESDKSVTNLKSHTKKGSGYISFCGGRIGRGAYRMALEGFCALGAKYPENIQINKTKRWLDI